jgi:hypothetical protein
MINFGIALLLSLGVNWLDLMTSSWLPVFLTVNWAWIGAVICIYRDRRVDRWLWIIMVHVWQLFYLPWPLIVGSFGVVLISTEIYDVIHNRFLHSTSRLISYLVGAGLLFVALGVESLLFVHNVDWFLAGQTVISVIILANIQKYYLRAAN